VTFLPDSITERDELPDDLDKDFGRTTGRARASADALGISATSFARTMSKAFADATVGGKKFDDVLRQLALRLSDMAVAQAFRPLARNLAGGLGDLFGGIVGEDSGRHGRRGSALDAISLMDKSGGLTAFAAGGVIAAANITVHIATPDADSFRRSEAYITGQIARAVARGQRGF